MSDILLQKDVKITGKLISLFKNCPKPDGWFGGLLYSKELGQVSVTGICSIKVNIGLHLDIIADLYDSSYGKQYKATTVIVNTGSKKALIAYLSSARFPKIGAVTAEKIVDAFGTDTISTLTMNPSIVQATCHLSDAQMAILTTGIVDDSVENQLQKAYPHLGATAVTQIIRNRTLGVSFKTIAAKINFNPYRLLEIDGLTFKKVDEVALLDCQLSWDDFRRINEILKMFMKSFLEENRSTYLDLNSQDNLRLLENIFVNIIKQSVNQTFIADAIQRLIADNTFYLDTNYNYRHLYLSTVREHEQTIVDEINSHLFSKSNKAVSAVNLYNKLNKQHRLSLNAGQKKALLICFENRLTCVTGGPGRGKTHLIKNIIDIWLKSSIKHKVILLAPTGKAVNRMKEATDYNDVSTIARFMYRNKFDANNADFGLYVITEDSIKTKLCSDTLVIIDEASMIDFECAAELLDLLHGCRFIFVGDKNQLPPISVGPFFAELLASNTVAVAELDENMRSKSIEISDNADKIIAGDKSFTFTDDFMIMPSDDSTTIDNVIYKYQHLLADGYDFKDILVLSPIKAGEAGVIAINKKMQDLVNPENNYPNVMTNGSTRFVMDRGFTIPAKKNSGLSFRVGDRVINTKNHADQSTYVFKNNDILSTRLHEVKGIFNGDMGTIIRYDFASGNESPCVGIMFDNDRYASIPVEEFDEFALSYCITIHKAQGSEAEHVLVTMSDILANSFFKERILTQNLLYTAVTRAKSSVTLFGNTDAIMSCVIKPYEYHNTKLGEFIYDKSFHRYVNLMNQSDVDDSIYDIDVDNLVNEIFHGIGDKVNQIYAGSRGGKGIVSLQSLMDVYNDSEDK